ncbi:MAG: DUF4399 domain-containing protein [Myxococcota bacterium]
MTHTALFLITLLACDTPAPEAPAPAPAPEVPEAPEPAEDKAPTASRRVFFKSPADGATVKSPVKLEFGVEGMEVAPAGEIVEGTGHHHVIIDSKGIDEGVTVPADDQHIHFGLGQTEAEIELPAGEHKLTMQFADGAHASYGEVMAATVTITVEE